MVTLLFISVLVGFLGSLTGLGGSSIQSSICLGEKLQLRFDYAVCADCFNRKFGAALTVDQKFPFLSSTCGCSLNQPVNQSTSKHRIGEDAILKDHDVISIISTQKRV
jgi:hypothetical protein